MTTGKIHISNHDLWVFVLNVVSNCITNIRKLKYFEHDVMYFRF